ncbi:hypothetical protein CcI49_28985 [Frankia sp. CcI49]|uniref:TetR/AcrR family transcriptional regulator n=1 Tax=Frankia sp. CcI49 TaxID=1745382 RepID=UPI00097549C9|nr:TetR/AcrR family transcriptional regulator [Frankia sp. CcI49]ONH55542.1 hypothetical protein CcI49_28985 [Frankia sp. CcI49]
MPDSGSTPAGRPLSRQREEALLDAALDVLGQVGYDKLTVGAVCLAAGASTKTAYRRWANKDELMAAALERAVQREIETPRPLADTGSLRGDLIASLDLQASSYRASPNLVVGLVMATRVSGDLGILARELIRRHETAYSTEVLRAAVRRGEIRADADAEFVADLARSFFLHEVLVRGVRPDHARITDFVDRVLLPVCSGAPGGPPTDPPRPAPGPGQPIPPKARSGPERKAMTDDYTAKYSAIKHSVAPITLEDEGTHFESLPVPSSQTDLWEETALGAVAESGDYDVLLWAAGYALFGNGKGLWGPGASAEREIQLIVVPKSQRGTMSDNDFVRVGWTPTERLRGDQFTVTTADDSVTWDFDGLRFISQPPTWHLEGKAGDAQLDLRYDQKGTPLWNWGPFAGARQADRAGYDVFVDVHGTIRTSKHDLRLTNGYGVREHIITGQSNDPVKNLPAPNWMWWLYTIAGDVKINFFQPTDGMLLGFVKYGDEQVNLATGNGELEFRVTEKWEDPRTAINLPVKWHLSMAGGETAVDVDIAAHGRAYSFWPTSNGVRMYCYLLSTMSGTVALPDGRTITLDQHLTVNSFCRTVLNANETSTGPRYDNP